MAKWYVSIPLIPKIFPKYTNLLNNNAPNTKIIKIVEIIIFLNKLIPFLFTEYITRQL